MPHLGLEVAGEPGRCRRGTAGGGGGGRGGAPGPAPLAARRPRARPPPSGSCRDGLASGWVRGALGRRSCPGPGPRDPAPGRSQSWKKSWRVSLESASALLLCLQYGDPPLNYIFILSAILAAYMICRRLLGNGGVTSESFRQKLVGGRGWGLAVGIPFLCRRLPLLPVGAACLFPLLPALPPLRKSSWVRQLKLPLGADFTAPLRIGEPFSAKFFAAGVLCAVAPRGHF